MFGFFESDKPGFKYFQALHYVLGTGSGRLLSAMRENDGSYIDDIDGKTYSVRIIAVVEGQHHRQYLCPIDEKARTELRPLALGSDGMAHLLDERFNASIDNTASRWDQGVVSTSELITVKGYTIVKGTDGTIAKPVVKSSANLTSLEDPEVIITEPVVVHKAHGHAAPAA